MGDLAPRSTGGSPDLPETTAFTTLVDRLDTSAPHFAAMADRLLLESAPSIGHGGQIGVLPRIWHVFMGGAPSARAVKHFTLDTSAPNFVAMANRLLSQSAPSIGHGGKVGVLPRIWYVLIVAQASSAQSSPHQESPGQPRSGQLS